MVKIEYEEIRFESNNTFVSVPMKIETCCADCMLWIFKYPLDIAVKDATFIRTNEQNKPDFYKYCQFCGVRHETKLVEKEQKE